MAYQRAQKYTYTITQTGRDGMTEVKQGGHAVSAQQAREHLDAVIKGRANKMAKDGITEQITALKFGEQVVIP